LNIGIYGGEQFSNSAVPLPLALWTIRCDVTTMFLKVSAEASNSLIEPQQAAETREVHGGKRKQFESENDIRFPVNGFSL
jgi:hypothetical protein